MPGTPLHDPDKDKRLPGTPLSSLSIDMGGSRTPISIGRQSRLSNLEHTPLSKKPFDKRSLNGGSPMSTISDAYKLPGTPLSARNSSNRDLDNIDIHQLDSPMSIINEEDQGALHRGGASPIRDIQEVNID